MHTHKIASKERPYIGTCLGTDDKKHVLQEIVIKIKHPLHRALHDSSKETINRGSPKV